MFYGLCPNPQPFKKGWPKFWIYYTKLYVVNHNLQTFTKSKREQNCPLFQKSLFINSAVKSVKASFIKGLSVGIYLVFNRVVIVWASAASASVVAWIVVSWISLKLWIRSDYNMTVCVFTLAPWNSAVHLLHRQKIRKRHVVTAFRRERKEVTQILWKRLQIVPALIVRQQIVCIIKSVNAMQEKSA